MFSTSVLFWLKPDGPDPPHSAFYRWMFIDKSIFPVFTQAGRLPPLHAHPNPLDGWRTEWCYGPIVGFKGISGDSNPQMWYLGDYPRRNRQAVKERRVLLVLVPIKPMIRQDILNGYWSKTTVCFGYRP